MNWKNDLKRSLKCKKLTLFLASAALILTVSVGGTVAYLITQSGEVTNTFSPATLPPTVVEDIDGAVKKEVSIKNSGDVPAYIRADVIVTWRNNAGEVYGTAPVENQDYSISIPGTDWVKGNDGYYYYTKPVTQGDSTAPLFTNAQLKTETVKQPSDYKLSIEVISQTIQANGVDSDNKKPVLLVWGLSSGGSVTAVDGISGNLTIATVATI